MSSGPIIVPLPLEFYWLLGKAQFLHSTAIYVFPPNLDVTLTWAPEEPDKVFLIFAITFGKLRDYATGEVVFTDDVGFIHRGCGMKLHWDPAVESILNIVYPHITPATKEEPFEIRLVNRSNRVYYTDISIWYFELYKKDYEELMKFIRGFINFYIKQ